MTRHFDLLCIGGGSGGVATANRAASYGARVGLVESGRMGGTCVNVGCVPKKIMWTAAQHAHAIEDAAAYGFSVPPHEFRWERLKAARDAYVSTLNGGYERNLRKNGVDIIVGRAKLVGPGAVEVDGETITAKHILIAVGGRPKTPAIPGAEFGITSDGFFELTEQPDRVAVVGAGYIAVEIGGLMRALGSHVTHFLRRDHFLHGFDRTLRASLMDHMKADDIRFVTGFTPARVERIGRELWLHGEDASKHGPFDTVLWAIGREPATAGLGLDAAGIATDARGCIPTDPFQDTNVAGIHAVGDVTGHDELTPVAIAAGRRLADRLFDGQADRRLAYENIATVIFSHPPIGTVGLSEHDALARFGPDTHVYETRFTPMSHGFTQRMVKTAMKLVVTGPDQRIVGCHVIGPGADEMMQGFAVAVRMGATKRDFDDTVAIHPTAAEELVTMKSARPAQPDQ